MFISLSFFSAPGTTLLVTVVDGATLWSANVGDSRGILFTVADKGKGEGKEEGEEEAVTPLSYDHKPCQVRGWGNTGIGVEWLPEAFLRQPMMKIEPINIKYLLSLVQIQLMIIQTDALTFIDRLHLKNA